MKIIQERTNSVRSMFSGIMKTRIALVDTWYDCEYYIPRTNEWKRFGLFKSLDECEVRQRAFINMHNKIMES